MRCSPSPAPLTRGRSLPSTLESPKADDASPPAAGRRWAWIGLSAAPASLMLGVTSIVSADVATVPFVWVLTLGLYLLTFVLAFAPRALVPSGLAARILPIAAVVFMPLLLTEATDSLPIVLPAHLAVLFVAALACHTELYRLRPHASHLTTFYALIGLGGALGGAFNALAAPILFDGWSEAPLAFVAACLLVPRAVPASGKKPEQRSETSIRRSDIAIPIGLGLSTLLLSKAGDALAPPARRGRPSPPVFPFSWPISPRNGACGLVSAWAAVLLGGELRHLAPGSEPAHGAELLRHSPGHVHDFAGER